MEGDEIPAQSSRAETELRLKDVLEDCWSENESSRPDFKSLKRRFRLVRDINMLLESVYPGKMTLISVSRDVIVSIILLENL